MLPKESRLRSREDFERVFRTGKTIFLGDILCLWRNRGGGVSRIGVAFRGKSFRRVATKHLYKRKMLEALRPHLTLLPRGLDIIILFQKRFSQEQFSVFQEKTQELLKAIKSIK